MDYLALADALALRFGPGLVTPPTGLKNITTSTARPPNNIPNTPFVIVWANDGDITYSPGLRSGEHSFAVTFYYSKAEGDIPREYTALLSWLGVLIPRLDGAMKLTLAGSGVLKSLPMKWEIGTLTYGGTQYEGITISVHVWTEEAVTLAP